VKIQPDIKAIISSGFSEIKRVPFDNAVIYYFTSVIYFCVCGKVINSVSDVREYVRQVQKSLGIQVSPWLVQGC
jgi:hypothetical protein